MMRRHTLSSNLHQHDKMSTLRPLRDFPEEYINISANWRLQRHGDHTPRLNSKLRQSLHNVTCSSGKFPTLADINGYLDPVPFSWFIGYLFGQDGEVEALTGTAHYDTYLEEWRAVTSRLQNADGRRNLAAMMHRESDWNGEAPTFNVKLRTALLNLLPASNKWGAKIRLRESPLDDVWEMERICWINESRMKENGGMAMFLRRELETWAADRFHINNKGYDMYREMWFRWKEEAPAQPAPIVAAWEPVAESPFVWDWTVGGWPK